MSAGSFTVNGTTFTTTTSDTVSGIVDKINAAQGQTGVRADYTTGGAITLTNTNYGSANRVDLSDANGVLLASAGSASATGTDAVANVVIDTNGSTAGGLATVTFTGGRYGQNALRLSDSEGNSISLQEAGNTASTFLAGQISVGSANFQIGANSGQTTVLSLSNLSASQLGQGVVSGKNMSNMDITTGTGATDALDIIDSAISEVSRMRGAIGSFQRNVVESNIRSLGVAKENLSASESAIRDVDVASEMANFTRLQILQQSGMAVLSQANSAPQAVLSLLR